MARIRMVKPEFFDDPQVGELSPLARLFFIGLWTQADREGRLIDDPRRLKARLFPFDDVDINALADELHQKDMIRRYKTRRAVEKHGEHSNRHDEPCKDVSFIWIRKFTFHQRPHPKEPASVIPACENGTGKKNGPTFKNTASRVKDIASPSESGVLILDPLMDSGKRKPAAATASQPNGLNGRSKRPIFTGQRLTVFDWMLDDMMQTLGSHTDAFDIHGWLDDLDRKALNNNGVLPRTEQWAWIQAELLAEVHRRGLPIATSDAEPHVSKQTKRLAAASEAFLRANK